MNAILRVLSWYDDPQTSNRLFVRRNRVVSCARSTLTSLPARIFIDIATPTVSPNLVWVPDHQPELDLGTHNSRKSLTEAKLFVLFLATYSFIHPYIHTY